MSGPMGVTPSRRVRHEVRDGVLVMAFSLVASALFAGLLVLVLGMSGR